MYEDADSQLGCTSIKGLQAPGKVEKLREAHRIRSILCSSQSEFTTPSYDYKASESLRVVSVIRKAQISPGVWKVLRLTTDIS